MNMKLFCDVLEGLGQTSISAVNGRSGIALAEQHHPDLILLDIQLPDISGLEVAETLKGNPALKHIPIIAVTASVMRGDEERIRASGCDLYVRKPIQVAEFMTVLRTYLGEAGAA